MVFNLWRMEIIGLIISFLIRMKFSRSQKLENVSIALSFLENEGVHLVNIDSTG
jgi:hypothetical protein